MVLGGNPKTGKLSELSTQRYTDYGKKYYALYSEDLLYIGERTMLYFNDASDSFCFSI